ncbi:MAG: hypothetical protein MJK04_17250 [Psychrosphaera sp.]|nr:hypothetical protein [Psychrosphaera sp.]
MAGLVEELQRDALEQGVAVSELLRKALVISTKLGVSDIADWIKSELNGYTLDVELIPAYRKVHGKPKYLNPMNGPQPLIFKDEAMGNAYSTRAIMQPIGEIVSLVNEDRTGKSRLLHISYPSNMQNYVIKTLGFPFESFLHVPATELIGILESVRNRVLDWALELEQQNILGEGFSFTKEEKTVAKQVNNHINIQNMTNSQIQQESSNSQQDYSSVENSQNLQALLDSLKEELVNLNLKQSAKDEVYADIDTVEAQLSSPSPKPVIVNESLKSIRSVLEGISGSVLATGLLYSVNLLIG